jgi:endonuclease G
MDRSVEESVGQLEAMNNNGWLERARKRVRGGHSARLLSGVAQEQLDTMLGQSAENPLNLGNAAPMIEAVIRTENRPPLIIRDGKVVLEDSDLPVEDFGADITEKVRQSEVWIPCVGRIEFRNHDMSWGGTGWIIGEDDKMPGHLLIATNRHVAQIVARRSHRGNGVYMFSPFGGIRYGSQIDFNEEVGAGPQDALSTKILTYTYLASDAASDVAIGRIKTPDGWNVAPIPLAEEAVRDDERIAVIGYPARDTRVPQSVAHMERYFGGLYDVKRYSPGLAMSGGQGDRMRYDATTTGGSSGSPVFSLDQQAVVGLHFQGIFGRHNSAVKVQTLKDILAGKVTSILLGDLPDRNRPEGLAELADKEREASHFEGRDGYDADFLAEKVPWPTLPDGVFNLAEPSDATPERPHELRYQHFGVKYCANLKSPVVTAVNIDGAQSRRLKRSRDRWYFDMRIPRAIQIGQDDYSNVACDRGHLVKREDPNWGDMETVNRANFDTFHYPNASPQHSGLNRRQSQWRGLEDHILGSARTHDFKATVFTGPVLDENIVTEEGVTIPLEYWKVVVMMTADDESGADESELRLHATAYLLSQGQLIHSMLADRGQNESVEGFKFGEFKTFQLAIADLEEATGYDFGTLRDADPMRAGLSAMQEFPKGAAMYNSIDDYSQLIL